MRKLAAGIALSAAAILGVAGCSAEDLAAETPATPAQSPVQKQPAAQEQPTVQLTASSTPFVPSVLHDGSPATAVLVEIANTSLDKVLKVNPLYFSITDSDSSKHRVSLGVADGQIGSVDLQPGEKISGVVAAKSAFTPARVTFQPLLGSAVIVDVVSV